MKFSHAFWPFWLFGLFLVVKQGISIFGHFGLETLNLRLFVIGVNL